MELIKIGHDITAYRLEKISKLRYGIMERQSIKKEIYKCLEVEQYYNTVSGNGNGQPFNREQILEALNKAKSDEVINFLNDCLIELQDNDETIFIIFG